MEISKGDQAIMAWQQLIIDEKPIEEAEKTKKSRLGGHIRYRRSFCNQ
ncbi:MAG: hypothetical protein H8E29_00245 [Anaerolineales bacterium]|uniref:Uncharacterized protein n=1 Tax=Candidatus Desulfolinea nitratireducens TaxID=2841698 RepID=A0A8J6TDD6_9CHLR|nr:hypothetical protein [Candidatus Desulfolinea nitratireducens]